MIPEKLSIYSRKKGLSLLGTGDITHPLWREELRRKLKEKGDGIYTFGGIDFILSGEVSNVYPKDGKLRKIHVVLLFPDFDIVEKVSKKLVLYGDLAVDGRPTLTLSVEQMAEILLSISEDIMIIPAHVWTPWFSLFGANSGFNSVHEAFGKFTSHITALETGLSSDPPMNWRLSSLDRFALVSNSDAHSPQKIGREANVFKKALNYYELRNAIKNKDKENFLFTIEFYPQEGKYHYDGHRNCGVSFAPSESMKMKDICPRCGRELTIGVLHRVEELADRPEGFVPPNSIPFKNLVPLEEIIKEAYGVVAETAKVKEEYERLISLFGSELEILLGVPEEELRRGASEKIVDGILRVREGKIKVIPGFDGVYGIVKIFPEEEKEEAQMSFF